MINVYLFEKGEIIMKKIFLFLSTVLLFSCSNFTNTRRDLDSSTSNLNESYSFIKNQAYMGGSVVYTPSNILNGHLQKDIKILIRLGSVIETDNMFTDNEEDALYGYIKVIDIDESFIEFSVTEIKKDNSQYSQKYLLSLGEKIDINNDGFLDLYYECSNNRRKGFENSNYLTFISSIENKKTSMYCVLPSQYSNCNYPNGIMGINPNRKIVATKYDITNSCRSVISGLETGDYILDNNLGKYQRIISNYTGNGPLLDEEIEDIQLETNLFEESDFSTKEQLEDFIHILYQTGLITSEKSNDNISILNNLLKDYELIKKAFELHLIYDIDDDTIYESLSNVYSLDSDMLIYTNRSFLTYLFPDYCSEKAFSAIAEIFPLLFCNIGGNENDYEDYLSENRSILTSTFDEYRNERNKINAEYGKYFNLPFNLDKYTVISKKNDPIKSKITDFNFKIGIQGKIENIWGKKIGMGIGLVLYVNLETELNASKNFINESLIGGPKQLCKLRIPINIGIVSLSIDFPLDFDLIFTLNGSYSYPIPLYGGITGLFGADIGGGVNYSVTWKKILFIPYPSLSCDLYSSSNLIYLMTSYLGFADTNPIDLLMPEGASINFIISPQFGLGAEFSALDCVSVGVRGTLAFEGRFSVASLNSPIKLASENKLPITSSVGFYIVPTRINGTCTLHLPTFFDTLFHKKWSKDFPITDFGTSIELWSKKLF